jgi:AraC family transcriptional regulator
VIVPALGLSFFQFSYMDPDGSYLINARVIGDRSIAEVFYPAGMKQERHRHDYPSFSFVSCGRYEESLGRQSHLRTAAAVVFHPAGEHHAVSFHSDVRIISVAFIGDRDMDSVDRGSSYRSGLVAWLGSRMSSELARSDTASSIAIEGIIDEMLVERSRGHALSVEKGSGRWLHRATEFVHDNFTTTISLDEIAQVAGVHSAHLSRVFRERMGCTVGEYVRRLRFEFASRQLLATDRPLCEVAQEAGFADQSHFSRLFRTRMGITPYSYRKLQRQR